MTAMKATRPSRILLAPQDESNFRAFLALNNHGWYTDTSTKPGGLLANVRHAPVWGRISHNVIRLRIRGSMTAFRRIYAFTAKGGSPGHPFPK